MAAHALLMDLTVVLSTAAITTILFRLLRLPAVLGYVLAGLIVGPHVPIPLVAGVETVTVLSELGVILLMFSLGLEFSPKKLFSVLPKAGVAGVVEMGVMLILGYNVGGAFGLGEIERVLLGGMVAISSTMIVAKVFQENPPAPPIRELVLGILVVEDLAAILLLTILTGISQGAALETRELLTTLLKLGAYLMGTLSLGVVLLPPILRQVLALRSRETTLVFSVGLCFGSALVAQAFGYSVALGAFLAGSVMAHAGAGHHVARLAEPLKDVFGAVFFVSVGMLMDPALVVDNLGLVAGLLAVVLLGKIFGVTLGALLGGQRLPGAVQAGFSLAQIGEFSFVMAAAVGAHAPGARALFPVAVAVSTLSSLLTPVLVKASPAVGLWADAKAPKAVQTLLALYGGWVEALRQAPQSPTGARRVRRLLWLMALDGAVMVAVLAMASMIFPQAHTWLVARLPLDAFTATMLLVTGVMVLLTPLVVGWASAARGLAVQWADSVFPAPPQGALDRAASPRRVLKTVLQLGILLALGFPLTVVAQPFLPALGGVVALGAPSLLLLALAWRNATDLQGHVRAGAQLVVELLEKPSRQAAPTHAADADDVEEMLPGLGSLARIRVPADWACVGLTLAQLHLRARTGATVVAVSRNGAAIPTPTAQERIQALDTLGLMGTPDALRAAQQLLREGPGAAAGDAPAAPSSPVGAAAAQG